MRHPAFDLVQRWRGESDGNYQIDFLGVKTDPAVWKGIEPTPPGQVYGEYPRMNEQFFEWVNLLDCVSKAERKFTMIELGAAWGPWLVRAAVAIRRTSKLPIHLVGVEGDKASFNAMRKHFELNGLNPDEHELIRAVATDRDGTARFTRVGKPPHWYGSRLLDPEVDRPELHQRAVEVPSVSLGTLLDPLERADMLHMDIQGAEFKVLNSSIEAATAKVAFLIVGIHSHELDHDVRELMLEHGWLPRGLYGRGLKWDTCWGRINFRDGCQLWVNPNLR